MVAQQHDEYNQEPENPHLTITLDNCIQVVADAWGLGLPNLPDRLQEEIETVGLK